MTGISRGGVRQAAGPRYFATASAFRAWLEAHHETRDELWVGFLKRGSGRPSITWPEAVDAALCYGWIDGVRRSVDEQRYTIRFTPRKARSNWSAVKIARAKELKRLRLMRPAGLRAFEQRDEASARYSYEQRHAAELEPDERREFQSNERAWAFFQAQAPSYRRITTWWVVSAKRPETRRKRLAMLIEDSARGESIKLLKRPRHDS